MNAPQNDTQTDHMYIDYPGSVDLNPCATLNFVHMYFIKTLINHTGADLYGSPT